MNLSSYDKSLKFSRSEYNIEEGRVDYGMALSHLSGTLQGGSQCYRCQTDLSRLLVIQKQADELKMRAIYLLRKGMPEDAREAIQKSLFLRQDPESERIEALILASQEILARYCLF